MSSNKIGTAFERIAHVKFWNIKAETEAEARQKAISCLHAFEAEYALSEGEIDHGDILLKKITRQDGKERWVANLTLARQRVCVFVSEAEIAEQLKKKEEREKKLKA